MLYRHGNRPRWQEATAYLQQVGAPDHAIASTGAPVLAYYLGYPPGSFMEPGEELIWLDAWNYEAVMAYSGEQWLVLQNDRMAAWDDEHLFRTWVHERGRLVAQFAAWSDVKDRTLYVYHVPRAATGAR